MVNITINNNGNTTTINTNNKTTINSSNYTKRKLQQDINVVTELEKEWVNNVNRPLFNSAYQFIEPSPRSITDKQQKDLSKVQYIFITDTPLPNDKNEIFDSPLGKQLIQEINKSKIKYRNFIVSYINDKPSKNPEEITEITENLEEITENNDNYVINYLFGLIMYDCFKKGLNISDPDHKLTIIFLGEKAKENFIKSTIKVPENPLVEVYYNQQTDILKYTSTRLFKESTFLIPCKTINIPNNDINSIMNNKGKETFLNSLDEIIENVQILDEVTNAKYISIDEFIDYLETVKQLYDNKQISYVAFDIETNTTEWSYDWSKICLVSMADLHTNMAYSCAQYHPEVWMSDQRYLFWNDLFDKLNIIYNSTSNIDISNNAKALIMHIKSYRKSLNENYKELFSYFEDNFMDNLIEFLPVLTTRLLKKDVESQILNIKREKINEFSKSNSDLLSKIKYLLTNKDSINEKIDQFWVKLSEVLSIVPIVGQNIKFDIGFLYSKNIAKDKITVVGDTLGEACMFSKALDDQGLKMDLDLESLYERETHKKNAWKSKFKSSDRLKTRLLGTRYDNVELENLGVYSALDSYCTMELHELFMQKMIDRIAEDKSNKVQTFLMEQNKALSMFSSGEVMMWSPLSTITKLLYERAQLGTVQRKKDIDALPVVKKFVEDNKDLITEFNINNSGEKSHKATILFNNRYFGFKSIEAGKSGAPSTDTEKVLKPLLSAIKLAINSYPDKNIMEYKLNDRSLKGDDAKYKMLIIGEESQLEPYAALNSNSRTRITINMLKEAKIFIESILDYSSWNKLNTAYIASVWDTDKEQTLPYRANFKIIGATLSGRLSSGMHTQPKAGNIRDMYNSIWHLESNRKMENNHKIGQHYNPDFGLVEIEYEDGTKEITTYKELQKEGLVK